MYTSTYKRIESPVFDGTKLPVRVDLAHADLVDPRHVLFSPQAKRKDEIFNQRFFADPSIPIECGKLVMEKLPQEDVFVARLLIKPKDRVVAQLPEELSWVTPFLQRCIQYEVFLTEGKMDYFWYLTVRHGSTSLLGNDDVWHCDGFQSMHEACVPRHRPERNYVWTSEDATEFNLTPFFIEHLDSAKYNAHLHFQKYAVESLTVKGRAQNVLMFDPYQVHRRPVMHEPKHRTLLRFSAIDAMIMDDKNTQNPHIPVPKFNRLDIRDTFVQDVYAGDSK